MWGIVQWTFLFSRISGKSIMTSTLFLECCTPLQDGWVRRGGGVKRSCRSHYVLVMNSKHVSLLAKQESGFTSVGAPSQPDNHPHTHALTFRCSLSALSISSHQSHNQQQDVSLIKRLWDEKPVSRDSVPIHSEDEAIRRTIDAVDFFIVSIHLSYCYNMRNISLVVNRRVQLRCFYHLMMLKKTHPLNALKHLLKYVPVEEC